ncbi:MAG: glycosyltransferase family 4 protein [Planctomycetes bacterium]|nr:glycosyltransferase family 4 protein [Planctomycetota bacterium]
MQVIALVSSPEHVCARYRLAAFIPALRKSGVDLTLEPWPPWWSPGFLFRRRLRRADAVIVQRRRLRPAPLARLRRAARFLIYDFDDAVFSRRSLHPDGLRSCKRQSGFERMVSAADAVVAGNAFLRDQACLHAGADRVVVVPTCIDPDRYPQAKHQRAKAGVRLVWIGSSSTMRGLEKISELLDEIGNNHPGLNLKIICDRNLSLRSLPVHFCRWSEQSEAAELADADIGISWLPPDDWSRGKCGLKVLQYMAAGLPVVANAVGVQPDFVRHGETGFLAESPAEWDLAIKTLAADPELRQRMGAAGRRRALRDFHVERGAAAWLDLLKTLHHRPAAASA